MTDFEAKTNVRLFRDNGLINNDLFFKIAKTNVRAYMPNCRPFLPLKLHLIRVNILEQTSGSCHKKFQNIKEGASLQNINSRVRGKNCSAVFSYTQPEKIFLSVCKDYSTCESTPYRKRNMKITTS
jgi:hypothetical protein